MTTRSAVGLAWYSRRISCRPLASASPVTVQVLTTHRSARCPGAASTKPLCSSSSLTYCVSYWLTLQPSVTRRAVRGVVVMDGLLWESLLRADADVLQGLCLGEGVEPGVQ